MTTAPYDWTPDLRDNERVLWQGQPAQSAYVFSWNDLFLVAVVVSGFQWAMEDKSESVVSLPEAANGPLVLFSVFFMCFVIWKRVFVDRKRRARAIYAITNQRAIIGNLHTQRVEQSIQIKPNLAIFRAGFSYRYVVFTKRRRLIWRLSQFAQRGNFIDGPPDTLNMLNTQSDDALTFLALKNTDIAAVLEASETGATR